MALYLNELGYSSHRIIAQALFCLGCFGVNFSYGFGYGAVAYSLPGEILLPEDKTIGLGIAQALRMVITSIFFLAYPYGEALVGSYGMFVVHMVVVIFTAIFVLRFLPETRNKSITEMKEFFQKKSKPEPFHDKKINPIEILMPDIEPINSLNARYR